MNRFNRDEPSPFFSRKGTDKDTFQTEVGDEGAKHNQASLPFGGLSRSNTGGSALGNGPGSPWGAPTTGTMSPMGNFGSFALPSGSNPPTTPGEKRPAFGRGESRLAHLMPKESSEELSSKGEPLRSDAAKSWRSRARTDTDPFDDESIRPGSAALGGQDISPPLNQQRRAPGLDTPSRQASGDLGMSDAPGFRDGMHGHGIQTPHERQGVHRGLESPTETNLVLQRSVRNARKTRQVLEATHYIKIDLSALVGFQSTIPIHLAGSPEGSPTRNLMEAIAARHLAQQVVRAFHPLV
jgi:PERQ amino acid-rich with GYF domain-containing protein